MNKSDQNIETLFSDALGSQFEVQGSTSWKQLMARRNKASFFRYSYGKMNIYYVTMISCALLTALFYLTNNTDKKTIEPTSTSKTEKIINPIINSTNTIQIEDLEHAITSPKNIIESKKEKEAVAVKNTISTNSINDVLDKTIVTPSIAMDTLTKEDVTTPKQETQIVKPKITKKVVVVQKNQVMVTDTILNVVTKKVRKRN